MSLNQEGLRPIITAQTLTLGNFLGAFLDSPIMHTKIRIGRVDPTGTTVRVGGSEVKVDNILANPGERVVIHKIL